MIFFLFNYTGVRLPRGEAPTGSMVRAMRDIQCLFFGNPRDGLQRICDPGTLCTPTCHHHFLLLENSLSDSKGQQQSHLFRWYSNPHALLISVVSLHSSPTSTLS